MKKITIILVILFSFQNLYAQDIYDKYKKAYSYIDSAFSKVSKTHINVCPLIRYVYISMIDEKNLVDSILKDNEMMGDLPYYLPFFDPIIDSMFNNQSVYDYYIYFGLPLKKVLSAEVRDGLYSPQFAYLPHFGRSSKFLFIFDEDDNIIQVYRNDFIDN